MSRELVTKSNEKIVKLQGATVANKLSFEPHLNLVCKKVSLNIHALLEFQSLFQKKAKSYHEGLYIVVVQLLSFGMDVPSQKLE